VDVAGRRVFVVGGSMGIGLAAAKRFAAGGAHVAIFARRRGPLDEARAACEAVRRDAGQRIDARELDVRDAASVAGVLGGLVALHGVPDVLLNCAPAGHTRSASKTSRRKRSPTRCRRTSTAAGTPRARSCRQ
jgi:NAD(P)-dependent dehydrogenase (short-subunit alcohol dehydrogenase family)